MNKINQKLALLSSRNKKINFQTKMTSFFNIF